MFTKNLLVKKVTNKNKNFSFLFFIFVLLSFIWIVQYLYLLPSLTIKNTKITGVSSVQPFLVEKSIREAISGNNAFFLPKDNSLFFSRLNVKTRILNTFPSFKDVSVRFANLSSIEIIIKERNSTGLWCKEEINNGECYTVADDGFIYKGHNLANAHIIYKGYFTGEETKGKYFLGDSKNFTKLYSFIQGLKELGFNIENVSLNKDGDFIFEYDANSKILVNKNSDMTLILRGATNLTKIANASTTKKIDYIDMRFNDKVFYKYY